MKKIIILMCFGLILLGFANCNEDEKPMQEEEQNEVVTINSDWFSVSHIKPQTYVIEEPKSSQGNVSYLIIGDDKAIMLDTGTGENEPENGSKIKHILDQLTSTPITLLLSHFHFDHNQNIAEFNALAFPDLPLLRQKVAADDSYTFSSEDLFLGNYPSQVQVTEWLPVNTDIDLGNRVIQLVNITGHTDESVAIIDKTNKIAFLGDYLYNGPLFLFDNDDLSLYRESVDHLLSILDASYRIFGAHGAPEIAFGQLQKLKDFLLCIEENTCTATAKMLWGYSVLEYQYQDMKMIIFQ